jgi:hypothetical protein
MAREHDKPKQLLVYANEQGANVAGWLFLTEADNSASAKPMEPSTTYSNFS